MTAPAPAGTTATRQVDRRVLLFGVLAVLSLAPVVAVDIPAGVDVPNHLARMALLTRGPDEPSPYYMVRWALYPNLAMDLVVPALARLVGVLTATKLFYLAAQVLLVSGAVALELALKRRFEHAGFVALLYLYGTPFAWGFLNFAVGFGLALWGAAAFVALAGRRTPLRLAVHVAVVAVLFLVHFFALGLYGVTVGLVELWRLVTSRRAQPAYVTAALWLAAPLVVLLGLLRLAGGAIGEAGIRWELGGKPVWLLASANGYSWSFSLLVGVLLTLGLAVLVRTRAVRLCGPGPYLTVGYAALFLATPFLLADTAFVDVRVVVAAAFVLPAVVTTSGGVRAPGQGRPTGGAAAPAARAVRLCAAVGLGLLVANVVLVTRVQLDYQRSYGELRASLALVERGARVLVATGDLGDPPARLADYPMFHAPTLAASERDAFVPTLFAQPGKQPLVVRESARPLAVDYGGALPVTLLRAVAAGHSGGAPAFVRDWTRDYDYVYVVGSPQGHGLDLPVLATGRRFVLYAVR